MLGLGLGLNKKNFAGAVPFDPSSLGLDLDLRTPNEALTTDDDYFNNGKIVFYQGKLSQVDVAYILDQSQNLAKSTEYSSDFSAGADGFAIGPSSPVTAVDGNIDSIGGQDDVLRLTMTNTVGYQYARKGAVVSGNGVYHISIDVYLPSSNSLDMGIWMGSGNATGITQRTIAKDQWVTVEGYYNASGIYFDIGLVQASNGSPSITPGAGDVAYFKNLVVSSVAGNHFVQTTASKCPHWDNTNFTVDFDGVDDEMSPISQSAFFAAVGSDTEGEFIGVLEDDEGAGVNLGSFPFNLDNGSGSATERIFNMFNTSNLHYQRYRESASNNDVVWSDSAETRGGRNTLFLSGNSTNYEDQLNGVDKTVQSGTNNGHWFNDIAVTEIRIARGNGLGFDALGFRYGGYKSARLTTENRTDQKTWSDSNV